MIAPTIRFCDAFAAELAATGGAGLGPILSALGARDLIADPDPHTPCPDAAIRAEVDRTVSMLGCGPAPAVAVMHQTRRTRWYRMLDGAPVPERLRRGLVVGQIATSATAPLRVGMFLLSPGLLYPLHQHEALEVYYPISGTLGVQHGRAGPFQDIPPGTPSLTPRHRLHALQTGDAPCLLIYAWTGAVTAPCYWWDKPSDRDWRRTRWDRAADGIWQQAAHEPVTAAMLAEAGEI